MTNELLIDLDNYLVNGLHIGTQQKILAIWKNIYSEGDSLIYTY